MLTLLLCFDREGSLTYLCSQSMDERWVWLSMPCTLNVQFPFLLYWGL